MREDLKYILWVLLAVVVLGVLPGEYKEGNNLSPELHEQKVEIEAQLEKLEISEVQLKGELGVLESTIRGDVPSSGTSGLSTAYEVINGQATVLRTTSRHTGKVTRMGQRSIKIQLAQIAANHEGVLAQLESKRAELAKVELEIASENKWYAKLYNNALLAKKRLNETCQSLLGMLSGEEEVQDDAALLESLPSGDEQPVASTRADRVKYEQLVMRAKELQASGNQLMKEKKDLDQELSLLQKREEVLQAKVGLGRQSLGASRYETARKEHNLCVSVRKTAEQKLKKCTQEIDALKREYSKAVNLVNQQKLLLDKVL